MAFEEKEIKKPFVLLLVAIIIQVTFVDTTNFDCKGKAFYCLNSTHFMICVDLGDGISRTVDDFLIPCPPPTICTESNNFECEYYTTTTPESIISPSEEMKPITKSALRTFWGDSDSTTPIPFGYKSDDSIKSEKYFNTVSITTTENNILDKVHSTASFIKLTPEETTQHSEEAFTADLTVPIDIQNGTETELHMQDRINEMLNANMFTTVFIPLTKKVPENVNIYESTIVRESTNTELTPFTVTGTEGYDSHSNTPSELYFDTISITTLSGSTEKPIFLNHETSSRNIIQENNISMDWNWKDKSEQSTTTEYYDTSNILDIFDASTTENKYEINTYSTRNTIPTTAEVDISLNDLHITTTNPEIQLPFQNVEISTNKEEGNTQSLISDVSLKVLDTTQSTDKTWHDPLTKIYQLEDITKSYGIKKKVRTNIFENQKKDKETKLHLDISTTDSERLHGDFSTKATTDISPPDIYLKTTVLQATERSDFEITTQLQDFLNEKRLFSTINEDDTSNSNDDKVELTTDLVGNEINIMGIQAIKQPQLNFKIKNRDVLDTDEMFTKVSTISTTKDYYTFEKGDIESTIDNDVTTSSQNLLFSVESTTSSYVSDDEVSNNISEVLNNKTKDKIAFSSVEIMRKNNVEIFPLSITTEAEESMTYNNISGNNNIFPIKLLNTHNKSTVNHTVYEKTSAVTENIINILTFSNVDLLENKVTSKDPLLISTRFDDLNLNADTVTDNFKHDNEYEETTNSKEKMISNVTNDSLLSRSFKNIKETKTINANILNVTHEESVIDLPVQMGLYNYEVITTESAVLPTQINVDDSYLNLPKESELLNVARENNLLITGQNASKTISEHNLRSDIDENYYFGDEALTDINLNTELNVPTVKPLMFTSKDQTLKWPFEKKSTLFFFTTEINSLIEENKQFDAATTATLLRDSYMLTTPENVAKLETIQDNFNEEKTPTNNEGTRILPDMLGTDVTFTEQVYMVPHTIKHFNIINKKIKSDKPAYDTLFQNNTVTDEYYKNENRDSKNSLNISSKIDNVTKLTNNYSSYNFTPNYIVEDNQDVVVTEFDSQIIKNHSKSLQKYPTTSENTDSSTSLYSTVEIGFASMLKSTFMYDKTKQINELNTLKDELISIHPAMNNSQDTTVVYKKEDSEARESNKMIQDFDYKTDISQVTVSYYGYASTLNEVKEVTTPDKPKLFVKHTINVDEYSTTPYQIKEINSEYSDLIQNKNISDKGQPATSDVNPTLTDNNFYKSPQSKDSPVQLLTLISNEKAVNSDIILINNQNKKLRPSNDIISYVLNQSTEMPPRIPDYETPNSDVQIDKTSKINIPEIEENNSKIKTNVSLIHLELHQNHSLLSSTSKLVDKFSTKGMHNGSTVNPGSIRVFDMVTAKTLSDNNSNIQKQHETNTTQPEKINMFSYKKNETNPVINKNITRHFYVTARPVNLKAINFNCLNRRSGKYSDHNNCQRFYICIGRLLPIVGQCPINTVFSEILKQCTHNLSHCIRNNQFQCITSGRFSDMWARDTYYICVKSNKKYIRLKLKCQKGYYLNRTSITCMEDNVSLNLSLSKDSYSTVSSSGSADSRSVQISSKGTNNEFKCVKQGSFPDPNDCKKYYVCEKQSKSEFRRKKKKCDSDEVFHKRKRKCVDEESYECTT